MDNNSIIVKSCRKGILGKLLKYLGLLIVFFILYVTASNIKKGIFLKTGIKSINEFMPKILTFPDRSIILAFVYILYIVLIVLSFPVLYRIICLFYDAYKKITIDYSKGSLIFESYFFPFQKLTDENKFDEIIEVEVYQSSIDNYLGTGTLYIEYVVCNKIDSQLRSIEIQYVLDPLKFKNQLI